MSAVNRKETRSQTLFKVLRKRRKTGATAEDLAQATGLKTTYLGSYLAEFKRVYGAKVKYRRRDRKYMLTNVREVQRHLSA